MFSEFEVVIRVPGPDRTEAIKHLLNTLERGKPDEDWLSRINLHHQGSRFYFDNWMLDTKRQELFNTADMNYVQITGGEFQMLKVFCHNPQRVLKRDFIYAAMHQGVGLAFCPRVIDVQIGRIRRKLGDSNAELFPTIRGAGYMLRATVREV